MRSWSQLSSTRCSSSDVPAACFQEPEDIPWVFNPMHRFRLTPQRLTAIHQHLFGGTAADLSERLSDFELVQLLICCTGGAVAALPRLHSLHEPKCNCVCTDISKWLCVDVHSLAFCLQVRHGTTSPQHLGR